jgi:hypothetical protein
MPISAAQLRKSLQDVHALLDDLPYPLALAPVADGDELADLADLSGRCQDRLLDLMAALTDLRAAADAAEVVEPRGGG